MRQYSINLEGRVKNFSLPKSGSLIPLYEAVVNSIYAIEERRESHPDFNNGLITIRVIRSSQTPINDNDIQSVDGFEIVDNGIGFTEKNMDSFAESDTTYKAKIGGKGVGRFTWLKAFSYVNVSSVYLEDKKNKKRDFNFLLNNRFINDTLVEEKTKEYKTVVRLHPYNAEYKKDVPKQIETIAMRIMQHCLIYFLDSNCPQIVITDDSETIYLNQLFQEKVKTVDNIETFIIKNNEFNLLHVKIEDKTFERNLLNSLYLCANNRLVVNCDLEKQIVDLDKQIFERNGFWYVGVLTSKYLDKHVDMNRLSFDIHKNDEDNLYDDVSLETIINESCFCVEKYLEDYLVPIKEEKSIHIEKYVINTAPQYRHLLKYMPEEVSKIKPKLSDDKLDDELYNIKRKFDKNSKQEQQELLKETDETDMTTEEYERYFQQQVKKISDANSAMLAEYVTHRRVIIELLAKGLRRKDDGKFNRESYMHNLIYPMKATSDGIDYEVHNLWLIDEKLSYCSFISSDIHFDNDPSQERTDILMLDHPVAVSESKNDGTVFDTIIIFELKRPMRDDYTDGSNPISQLYSYVRKIRNNEAKDKYHRTILVNNSTKYYLYAVCDITPKLLPFIDQNGFTLTPDNLGYYNFNKTYNAYFEVLSYDKILYDAKKRNRVLFDKLGLEK
jgi:parvulin-like peptidyl-prolyl isomerase